MNDCCLTPNEQFSAISYINMKALCFKPKLSDENQLFDLMVKGEGLLSHSYNPHIQIKKSAP